MKRDKIRIKELEDEVYRLRDQVGGQNRIMHQQGIKEKDLLEELANQKEKYASLLEKYISMMERVVR